MNQYSEGSSSEDLFPVGYFKGMREITPYLSQALRVTSCDIMCTSNTARPYELPLVRSAKKSASLPYKTPDILPVFSSGATDLQLLVNSESKKKRCDKLKKERSEFLFALHEGRDEITRANIFAATRIQARFRGYRRRRGSIDLNKIVQDRINNPRLTTSKEIREELTEWAGSLGLKPVHGLSLESAVKKSTHQKKLEAHAATTIKRCLRVAVAIARVRRKRTELFEKKKNAAAATVQRFFKYIVFQTKLEGVVSQLKRKGAVQIQTYCRGFMARFRLEKEILLHSTVGYSLMCGFLIATGSRN